VDVKQPKETRYEDPVLGPLVWDGFHHKGWGGSFADPRFITWGGAVDTLFPEPDEDEEEPRSRNSAQSFLSDLLSVAGGSLEQDEQAAQIIEAARDFARRVDAYDGSLDFAPLRRAGRFKVVVHSGRDEPPTDAQRSAWRAFREGGDALAARIAQELLETYRRQRPQRVRWWKALYGDPPDTVLPDVTTTAQMQSIVQPSEFWIYRKGEEGVDVGILLGSGWATGDIEVRLREGKDIVSIAPHETNPADGWVPPPGPRPRNFPVFGPLRWADGGTMSGWCGTFHSDGLRGWRHASETRFRAKHSPHLYGSAWRELPPWDTITGDFELLVRDDSGQGPIAAQTAAYRAFTEDPQRTAEVVLAGILKWYREIRPGCVKAMRRDPEEIAATMPDVKSPQELLEIIQLQSAIVWPQPPDGRPAAIGLSFCWEDEHGLGVLWRDGRIENVGDWESAADEG
jgi:hypothetical protein